jgi:hypothetical protein
VSSLGEFLTMFYSCIYRPPRVFVYVVAIMLMLTIIVHAQQETGKPITSEPQKGDESKSKLNEDLCIYQTRFFVAFLLLDYYCIIYKRFERKRCKFIKNRFCNKFILFSRLYGITLILYVQHVQKMFLRMMLLIHLYIFHL